MVLHYRRLRFGHSLEADAKNAVLASGGKVLGSARHPLNNPDFSSYLLQAQASGAKVVALANAGGDMINATKQANEFGVSRSGQTVVSLLVFITDIHSLGLAAAQGLRFVTGFYWDRNDETRIWSKRFFDRASTHAYRGTSRHLLRNSPLSSRYRGGGHRRGEGGHGENAGDTRQ